MDDSSRASGPGRVPDLVFDEQAARRAEPCTPRELFYGLFVEPEEHVHFIEPALRFVSSVLARGDVPVRPGARPELYVTALTEWAIGALRPLSSDGYAFSWPARVAREFGPAGLTDGAWLSLAGVGQARGEKRDWMGEQLALRLGGCGAREAYAERYASLLRSLGVPPESIARWEFDDAPACADISYEHGLLGLCLGLFPNLLAPEAAGFNLWMAAVGPCPLLQQLREELELRGACVRYLERYERGYLSELAKRATCDLLGGEPALAERVGRGFAAAHASYLRWERAMSGGNVPFTPRDFVLEGIRRKARFAAEHHGDVRLGGHSLEELFREGGAAHELLLDHLAQAGSLIRPGAPDRSPFITHALSLDGPMFDAFTAAEKNDLREWIASLGKPTPPAPGELVPLVGTYVAPLDATELEQFAVRRYGELCDAELTEHMLNVERHPAVRSVARALGTQLFDALRSALQRDADTPRPPSYSERAVRQLIADADRGVARFTWPSAARLAREPAGTASAAPPGRFWLQGFADVRRAGFDEYALLLSRYLVEVDGAARVSALPVLAATLNTRRFMPELLGINLALEAVAAGADETCEGLRIALAAVLSFMARVAEGSPPETVDAVWHRLWRAWHWQRELARDTDRST